MLGRPVLLQANPLPYVSTKWVNPLGVDTSMRIPNQFNYTYHLFTNRPPILTVTDNKLLQRTVNTATTVYQ